MTKKVLLTANIYKHFVAFHLPYIQLLKDNGCQVDLMAGFDDIKISQADNCFYWNLTRSPYSFQNYRAYKQLKKLIEKEKYDLIHCHTATAATITRLAARTLRKKQDTKVLYTAHGFHFYKGSPLVYWLIYYPIEKFLSKYTDGIILINSEDYHLVLNHGFKNLKTYRINGIGVNTKRFAHVDLENGKKNRAAEGYDDDQFLMIYVAEYIQRKNHRFLIDASLELAKKIEGFKILFAGRGKLRQKTQAYAESIGADKYIDFLGVRFDLDRLLPMCDMGVSSSRQEGLPLAVTEEMLCGLPVLATQIRGHGDLVIHGETGFLYQPDNIADFVKYAVDLYKDPYKRNEMGKAAYQRAQNFKLEQSLESMAEIYSELLEKPIKCL